jgi:hypothetical protein
MVACYDIKDVLASLRRFMSATESLSYTDRAIQIALLTYEINQRLIRFTSDAPGIVEVSGSRSSTRTSDASGLTAAPGDDDDEGHIDDGHNAPNNDGAPGLATFGATTASTVPMVASVSSLTAAPDDDDDGHIDDGHNAPNNDGAPGLATFGATTASIVPTVVSVSVPSSDRRTVPNPGYGALASGAPRTSDASSLTAAPGDDEDDEGHIDDGHPGYGRPLVPPYFRSLHLVAKTNQMTKPKKKSIKSSLLRKLCAIKGCNKRSLFFCVTCEKFYCQDGQAGKYDGVVRYCMSRHMLEAYVKDGWADHDESFREDLRPEHNPTREKEDGRVATDGNQLFFVPASAGLPRNHGHNSNIERQQYGDDLDSASAQKKLRQKKPPLMAKKPPSKAKKPPPITTTCAIKGCTHGTVLDADHTCYNRCGQFLHSLCAQTNNLCDKDNELNKYCSMECKISKERDIS